MDTSRKRNLILVLSLLFSTSGLAAIEDSRENADASSGFDSETEKPTTNSFFMPYTLEELNEQNVWFVSNPGGLNCRRGPGSQYQIVYEALPLFTSLVAFDYAGERGVSGGSSLNWLKVIPKGPVRPQPCYVAADSRYIQPEYPDSTWRGGLADRGPDDTCSRNYVESTNSVRLVTKSHIIYLCTSSSLPVAKIQYYLSFRRGKPLPRPPDLALANPEYDPRNGGQLIFRNSNYSYQIDLPSLRFPSAFLSVVFPDGTGYDEMIIEWLD